MNHLRKLVTAALALFWAGAVLAQTPPPSGLYPSTAVPADAALVGPGGPPIVTINDNAPANVPKLWFTLGPSLHWVAPTPMPSPLLTTSDPVDQGILGNPSTVILLGTQKINYGGFFGIHFGSGSWWNAERTIGMEGSSVWSEQRGKGAIIESDLTGTPALFRPIIDPTVIAESSVRVSEPGLQAGSLVFATRMRFNNSDTTLLFNVHRDEERTVTILAGWRTMYIREEMRIIQNAIMLADDVGFFEGQPLLAGDVLEIRDRIETVNWLYIPQVGLRWERTNGPVTVGLTTKLGVGWSHQRIFGDGRTTLEPDVRTVPGGVLVQRSFRDRNQLEEVAFVPEVGVRIGVRVRRRLQANFAYNFLYASSVSRPGKYVDRVIELTQMPTSTTFTGVVGTRPVFREADGGFTLHGMIASLTWSY